VTGIGDSDRGIVSTRMALASFIDYTLLRGDASRHDIEQWCRDAIQRDYYAICVNPGWVELAKQSVDASAVRVATVIAFPLGAVPARNKAFETRVAVDSGADEIDMVIAYGRLIDGEEEYIVDEVAAVVDSARGRVVKAIIETAALSRNQIVRGALAAQRGGAHMVKTSTGFHPLGGATLDVVRLLRTTVGETMGVKASGGIRDEETARRMIEAGASRIGTSTLLG